ncbi:MAG TPA: GSCFA domain-containing protein [Bacteroidales bacterium]|nr:GSCFA domain-containing protein [Bacteroidales bacterium]HPK29416.1 GSCFA domain-containing protein [Bacteroidales bacterium]
MMILQTPVEYTPLKERLGYKNKYLFIGSCFAAEIGSMMKDMGFDLLLNPFGVLYNPASIHSSINRLASGTPFTEKDIITSDGRYTSFFHHSTFTRESAEEFLTNANACLERDSARFAAADTCVVTLGTAWVFRHLQRDIIVSNCHKIHPAQFRRERLETEEVTDLLCEIVEAHPDKKWIFTVSPIRHLKDTAHGNQLSKSILLLAIDRLQQLHPQVEYFPAYEIMMDELRDYRFYAENMTHPTNQSIRYIFDRFCDYAIDDSEMATIAEAQKRLKASRHISFTSK